MNYEVLLLPMVDRDILRISDALAGYPGKAKRLFHEIEKKLKILENIPYLCPVYQMKSKYRQMVLEDHLLFYRVDEEEKKVKVYRVLYSRMDGHS